MARPPEWISRIPKALSVLSDFPSPLLDRAAVASLLGVSQRTANRILGRLGGEMMGGGLVIPRRQLVDRLESLRAGEEYEWQAVRRRRVEEAVREAAAVARSRRVVIAPAEVGFVLPATVRLGSGRLEVAFSGAEDLLGQLYALVQVAATDYDEFERMIRQSNTRSAI